MAFFCQIYFWIFNSSSFTSGWLRIVTLPQPGLLLWRERHLHTGISIPPHFLSYINPKFFVNSSSLFFKRQILFFSGSELGLLPHLTAFSNTSGDTRAFFEHSHDVVCRNLFFFNMLQMTCCRWSGTRRSCLREVEAKLATKAGRKVVSHNFLMGNSLLLLSYCSI